MRKSEIKVTKNNFNSAKDPEMCLIWAEKFLKNDNSINEEIQETIFSINNENLWAIGSETKEQEEMHLDNEFNLHVYLLWLREIEAELD